MREGLAAADRAEPVGRAAHDPGIPGRFGVIRRRNGQLQVTHRGLPVYTYAHERAEQVLCNNVDGWFVVRLR